MRGDLDLHLRLLGRPEAVAGLVSAVAGATALAATYLPWYQVAARVEVLGASQARAVAALAGWQAHPWGWFVPALAIAAIVVGVAVAVDRPPPTSSRVTLALGVALALAVVAGGLLSPPVSRFDVAGSRLRELAALSGRLPDDIDLTFSVRPSVGLWLTLSAAVLLVAAAATTRRTE